MKKSTYRMILIVAGLLYFVLFFLLPYAKLEGALSDMSKLAGALGAGDLYPEKLTGLNAVKNASILRGDADFVKNFMLMPLVIELAVILFNILGKKRLSYVGTIIVGVIALLPCGMNASLVMEDYKQLGYKPLFTGKLLLILVIVQIAVAIIGCVKDKGQAAAVPVPSSAPGASKGRNVKAGKKDGKLIGVSGAYAGAEIPVKDGDTVVIGRDPAVCSIVIKDEKASRKHCEVAYNAQNGMYMVTDYSSNGTFRSGGERMPGNTAVPMQAGSTIQIGKDGETFRLG